MSKVLGILTTKINSQNIRGSKGRHDSLLKNDEVQVLFGDELSDLGTVLPIPANVPNASPH
jgi:hypothetical protein